MTYLVVALLVGGVASELYGLWTIAVDVRDAATKTKEIADEKDTLMAANKDVVADWISRVAVGTTGDLARRKRGLWAIALGLGMQTAANFLALWA